MMKLGKHHYAEMTLYSLWKKMQIAPSLLLSGEGVYGLSLSLEHQWNKAWFFSGSMKLLGGKMSSVVSEQLFDRFQLKQNQYAFACRYGTSSHTFNLAMAYTQGRNNEKNHQLTLGYSRLLFRHKQWEGKLNLSANVTPNENTGLIRFELKKETSKYVFSHVDNYRQQGKTAHWLAETQMSRRWDSDTRKFGASLVVPVEKDHYALSVRSDFENNLWAWQGNVNYSDQKVQYSLIGESAWIVSSKPW